MVAVSHRIAALTSLGRVASPACNIFDMPYHQGGPTRLVICAKTFAGIAIEIFLKQNQIFPMFVLGKTRVTSVAGTLAGLVWKKHSCQTRLKFPGNLL
jgi:hypothetical protein